MSRADRAASTLDADWLAVCRSAGDAVAAALARYPSRAERERPTGRGEGGDMALVIDRAAEDAVFAELRSLGQPMTVVSEERGHVALAGGGPVHVVVDPVDGSLNAKRGLPFYCLSIAVAVGDTMGDVNFGYVLDLGTGEEWWATEGGGAQRDGRPLPPLEPGPLEILAIESAHPHLVAAAAADLEATGAARLRALGSIALSLCSVAAGRADAMVSLRAARSVDAAAGQLVVREAGGSVAFPDVGADPLAVPLALDMRSRVAAAHAPTRLDDLIRGVLS